MPNILTPAEIVNLRLEHAQPIGRSRINSLTYRDIVGDLLDTLDAQRQALEAWMTWVLMPLEEEEEGPVGQEAYVRALQLTWAVGIEKKEKQNE